MPALAQNTGLDELDRRDKLFGWEAVGKLTIGRDGYCSGVLISSDIVLTAAHCVVDRHGRKYPASELHFHAGQQDGQSIASRGVIRTAPAKGYDPRYGITAQSIRNDVALVQLDEPISTFDAPPFALHSGQVRTEDLSVVSYGQGRDANLSWQKRCGLEFQGQGLFVFNCDVTFGSSGAPVFAKEGGRTRVLTLVSSGSRHAGGTEAFGMQLPETVARLKRELAQTPVEGERQFRSTIKRIGVGSGRNQSGAKFVSN